MSESDGNVLWVKLNLASLTSTVVLQVGYTAETPGGCAIQVAFFYFFLSDLALSEIQLVMGI